MKPRHYKTELLFTEVDDFLFAKLKELFKVANLPLNRITVTRIADVETTQASFICYNTLCPDAGINLPIKERRCCGSCNQCCNDCPPLLTFPQTMNYVTPDLHNQPLEVRVARAQEMQLNCAKYRGGKKKAQAVQDWLDTECVTEEDCQLIDDVIALIERNRKDEHGE